MGDVLCVVCTTKHENILMFLVMICALIVLVVQDITEPDEN